MRFGYYLAWRLARLGFRGWFRWRVLGADRVPATGACLLASNHASYLDPPLIGCAVKREIHYLARESLFEGRLAGWLLRRLNAVPVDRDGRSPVGGLRVVLDRLARGAAVVVFPEGTRSRDGGIQRGRSGLGLLVLRSGAPVIPVRIFGSYEAFGRHRALPRFRPVAIKFGKPMLFLEERRELASAPKARQKEIYEQVSARVMEAIASLEPVEECSRFPMRAGGY